MPLQKIQNASRLSAAGMVTTLLILILLIIAYPILRQDMVTFLMLINVVMVAINLFLLYFLLVMAKHINPLQNKKRPAKKKRTLKVI